MRRSLFAGLAALAVVLALPAPSSAAAPERLIASFASPADAARAAALTGGRRIGPTAVAVIGSRGALERLAGVRRVARDGIVRAAIVPNDPCVTSCEGGKSQTYLPTVGAAGAWDRSRGGGVVVAVLDSGVDPNHPDLAPKLEPALNLTDADDGVGAHGTQVAGIVAAATNNGIGVASLGWDTRILPIKVLDASGTGFVSWVVEGVYEATDRGAKIINLSLASLEFDQVLQDAINYAAARGVLVIAAAGNNDDPGGTPTTPKYPAAMQNVVAVGATTNTDTLATFSRRGPWVDLLAPGTQLLTTAAGGGYVQASGTSIASPVVAGAAALLIAQGFETSPNGLLDQLQRSGTPISDMNGGTIRRVHAGYATLTSAPYGGFGGGASVARGELAAGHAGTEIVAAAGPGGGPHVRVYNAGLGTIASFYAYASQFPGGVDVAVGDVLPELEGEEIVTGAGAGGGAHVRVFRADGSPAPGQVGAGFFAYNPEFTGGVNVAVGDIRPDLPGAEIVTAAASQGGPHVRVFQSNGNPLSGGFYAFDPRFTGGINIAVGNFDADVDREIAVGAGPGGGSHIRLFQGDGTPVGVGTPAEGGFFAYAPSFTGGVDVAVGQVDGGPDEVISMPRTAGGPHVRAFRTDGAALNGGFYAFNPSMSGGLAAAVSPEGVTVTTRNAPTLLRVIPLTTVNFSP